MSNNVTSLRGWLLLTLKEKGLGHQLQVTWKDCRGGINDDSAVPSLCRIVMSVIFFFTPKIKLRGIYEDQSSKNLELLCMATTQFLALSFSELNRAS